MKLVRLAGIGEIIITTILGAGAYFGINNQAPLLEQINSNEFNAKTMGILLAALLIIRLLIGLVGLIGKGRGLCVVSGLILLTMSAPDVISWTRGEASLFQMIFQGLVILFALLFFIGAFFVDRKPKVTAEAEGVLEGAAPTESIPASAETADNGFDPLTGAPVETIGNLVDSTPVTAENALEDAMDSVQTTADNVVDNAQIPITTTRDTITDVMDSVQTTANTFPK